MKSPIFSIILPTYNRLALLPRAVESVLSQDYTDWELIIIDDGSTDGTKEYISGLDNDSIKYQYQENKGRSAARNLGIEKSTGEYICFLDSDDELLEDYLTYFYNMIEDRPQKIILAGVRLSNTYNHIKILPSPDTNKCVIQCLEGYFNLMPFCFHKSLMLSSRFNDDLYYGEDYQFYIPLIAANIPSITMNDTSIVHQHSGRTINRVYQNIGDGYSQLQRSVLSTLEDNKAMLSKFVDINKLDQIKQEKIKNYITAAAKYSFREAYKINKKETDTSISTIKLLFQRMKGILQS